MSQVCRLHYLLVIVVVLLLVLGQSVHQVVRGLVGDVRQEPADYQLVPVQLELDRVPGEERGEWGLVRGQLTPGSRCPPDRRRCCRSVCW